MMRTTMVLAYSLAATVLFFAVLRVVHIESGWSGYWLAAVLTLVVTFVAIADTSEKP